jgi:prolyl oligopeptidase
MLEPVFTTGAAMSINTTLVYARRAAIAFAAATCLLAASFALAAPASALDYPASKTGGTVDDYHGVEVADPYRWLEDLGSPEVHNWVEKQNKLTFSYLGGIKGRQRIFERLKEVTDYERISLPSHTAGRYFFSRNDGLQNQSVRCWSAGLDGEQHLLLDPNSWSEDGTVALAGKPDVSDDGQWLLYGMSTHGSDWIEWRAKNITTGEELPDVIKWSKGGAIWDKTASGFYYERLPEPEQGEEFTVKTENEMFWYHKLGTPQSDDRLVFSLPEHPDWFLGCGLNEERDMLLISIYEPNSRNNRLYTQDVLRPGAPVEKTLDANDAQYHFISNTGRKLLLKTTLNAPNWRVVEVDMDKPGPENWREVLPECAMALTDLTTVGGYLFATYIKDAHDAVYQYTMSGELVREIKFPVPVSAGGFKGRKGDTETYYSYSGFTTPRSQYRLNIETGETTFLSRDDIKLDTSQFEAHQFFYRAKDGMAIPIFVMHKKGIELDGSNPTILSAYGGFGGSQTPYFSNSLCVWLEMGGVYAIACLRGGGEYGEDWHQAAIKTHKQVSYDDFIAGAEWLVGQGYCSAETLACSGWSNGGLMVGAVVNQRPELFCVALAGTGVMDMLRFNLFGWGGWWQSEYGSPQDPGEFVSLYAISPYHNITPGVDHPATMILTADTDDRVMPGHSFKYAARLQAAQGPDGPPVLLRVEVKAGHGAGVPLAKQLMWTADQYAFTLHEMGFAVPQE